MNQTPYRAGSRQQPWIPLALAAGIHLLALLPALLAPHLSFFQRQLRPEVHTVTLFNVADLPAPTPAAAPKTVPAVVPAPAAPPPAPVAKPETPSPEAAPRAVPTQAPKAAPPISLRPRLTSEDKDELQKLREITRLEAEEKKLAREAELAKQEALASVRDLHSKPAIDERPAPAAAAPDPVAEPASDPAGDTAILDAATREYSSRLHGHIQAHWSLPNLPTWDENLLATIVITIRRDGRVSKTVFERRSDNSYFNQLVQKTIRDASPMPPFPDALRQDELEFGLNFRPGGIF